MYKASHRTLIFVAGFIWMLIGVSLLTFGMTLVIRAFPNVAPDLHFSLLRGLSSLWNTQEQAIICLLSLSLFVGYLKGNFVLSKSAKKQMNRILSFSPPVSILNIYSPAYYILIAGMMGLGMSMKFLPISMDTRGAIDIAIGAALIRGAFVYFRFLYSNPVEQKTL